jgi:hypothetical protein
VSVIEEGKFCDLGTYDAIALKLMSLNVLRVLPGEREQAKLQTAARIASLCSYTVLGVSIKDCPSRPGFDELGWTHVGAHERIGRMYWNWFKTSHPSAVLVFHDSPDFSGRLEGGIPFVGDINQAGVGAFVMAMTKMPSHSLWISVSEKAQVIIESLFDISKMSPFKSPEDNLKDLSGDIEPCEVQWARCHYAPGHRMRDQEDTKQV